MPETALSIIKTAMRKIGAISSHDELDGTEGQDHLAELNRMIESWGIDGLMIYALTEETFTLQVGVASYTIGSGGAFDTTRPSFLNQSSFLRDSTGFDTPLEIINKERYNAIANKTTAQRPEYACYEAQYPLGVITFYGVPEQAYDFHCVSEKPLTAFTDINQAVQLPPGYSDALIYNLAVRLAPEYETEPSQVVAGMAYATKRLIETRRPLISKISIPAGDTRMGNIFTFGQE